MGLEIFFLYATFHHHETGHHQLSGDEKRRRDIREQRGLPSDVTRNLHFTTSFIVAMINLSSTVAL